LRHIREEKVLWREIDEERGGGGGGGKRKDWGKREERIE